MRSDSLSAASPISSSVFFNPRTRASESASRMDSLDVTGLSFIESPRSWPDRHVAQHGSREAAAHRLHDRIGFEELRGCEIEPVLVRLIDRSHRIVAKR